MHSKAFGAVSLLIKNIRLFDEKTFLFSAPFTYFINHIFLSSSSIFYFIINQRAIFSTIILDINEHVVDV